MDYQRIYDELISFRKTNIILSGYSEKHHIQMRSLGGADDESNLVKLTAREHYVAHLLLARFNRCSQTAFALWMMQCKSSNQDRFYEIRSSRMYEWLRNQISVYNRIGSTGERNSQHGTRWICNIDLKENRKISKADELPQGWILGRNKWNVKSKKRKLKDTSARDLVRDEWINKYLHSGKSIREFVRTSAFPYSHVTLSAMFKRHQNSQRPEQANGRGC